MSEIKLTERRIEALPIPETGAYIRYWDSEIQGLGVKVLRSGKRVYIFKDRLNGKPIWGKNLPRCSETSLAEMRGQAIEWKAQIRKGENPWERPEEEKQLTVYELCQENLRAKRLASSTETFYRRLLAEIGGAKLGAMKANEVGVREAQQFLRRFRNRQRYHDALRGFLSNSFAFTGGELQDPFFRIPKIYRLPDPNKLPRFSDEDIGRLCHFLRKAERNETRHSYDPVWISFIWFLVRAGTRPTDTLRIERSWISHVDGQAVIWHPRTKTGFAPILLSPAAVEVVESTPGVEDNPHLFPGKDGHLKSYAKNFARLAKEAELPHRSPYAIRRWFARTGRLVFQGDIGPVQALLDWDSPAMAMRYAGEDEKILESIVMQRSEISNAVAQRVDEITSGQLPNSYRQLPNSYQNIPNEHNDDFRASENETSEKPRSAKDSQRSREKNDGSGGGIRTPDQLINRLRKIRGEI